ncbi:MAG TPA: hypothetical protein VEP91_11575 [Solirubrobacterales bacterium]|nr:hypothetical protein [Solirubrobacterales bacterium]
MATEPETQSGVSKEIQSTFARALLPQRASRVVLGGFRFFGDRPAEPAGDALEDDAEPVEKAAAPDEQMERIAKGLRELDRERPDLRVGWAARLAERHAAMTGNRP